MGVAQLVKERNIVFSLLKTYLDYQLQNRNFRQLEVIKMHLMRANIHIAASTLTSSSFSLGATLAVVAGLNIALPIGRNIGQVVGVMAGGLGI